MTLAGPKRARRGGEMRELAVIPDGAMLVQERRVVLTGTRKEVQVEAGGCYEVVDAGGRVVLPGFVDAHTPVSYTHLDVYKRQ